ncbi:MAG: hypothetical protein AB7C89_04370 [Intestinibacillus sp.]
MATKAINHYLRAVNKQMPCCGKTRRVLTEGLRQELADFAAVNPDASYEDLCRNFGPPEITASDLRESVDPADLHMTRRKRRVVLGVCVALLLVCILLLLRELWMSHQVIENGSFVIVEDALSVSPASTDSPQ